MMAGWLQEEEEEEGMKKENKLIHHTLVACCSKDAELNLKGFLVGLLKTRAGSQFPEDSSC